jgi:hypothetical protein
MQNTHQARKPMQNVFSSKDNFYAEPVHLRRTSTASARQSSTVSKIGGAERDRTADPLLAKQVLSQLSYSPIQLDNQQIAPSARQHNHITTVKSVQACQAKPRRAKAGGPG